MQPVLHRYQLDNEELSAELQAIYRPKIHQQARVARQRICPIGDLIAADGETRALEYKLTLRWDVKEAFYRRTPVSTEAVSEEALESIIVDRWRG